MNPKKKKNALDVSNEIGLHTNWKATDFRTRLINKLKDDEFRTEWEKLKKTIYVIQIDEYFDNGETPCDSTVKGYFTSKEHAHDWLIANEYKYEKVTDCWFDECVDDEYYELISENEMFNHYARIIGMDLIL